MKTPILFITFKKVEQTKRVFERIRKAQPPKLYISSDGPRKGNTDDEEKVTEIRNWIKKAIDWPCDIEYIFSDDNQGCKWGVVNAINYVFEREERIIIIEDDILCEDGFFPYIEYLLEKYENDKSVMMVSGCKSYGDVKTEGDYFFSRYAEIWGWATWKRAWQKYDPNLEGYNVKNIYSSLRKYLPPKTSRTYADLIYKSAHGAIDTWDYQWMFTCMRDDGRCIIPSATLIDNIGFETEDAVHTQGDKWDFKKQGIVNYPPQCKNENVCKKYDARRNVKSKIKVYFERVIFYVTHPTKAKERLLRSKTSM